MIPLDAIRRGMEALTRLPRTPLTEHALTTAPDALKQLAALDEHLARGGQVDWVWKNDPRTLRLGAELKRTQAAEEAWRDQALQAEKNLATAQAELEQERQQNGRLRADLEMAQQLLAEAEARP